MRQADQAEEPGPAARAPAFVGRDREVSTVVESMARSPVLLLVEGEAGIGKTRLVAESLRAASPRPTVVEAACPPLREPFPLGPLVEALSRRWQQVGPVPLSPLAGALRPLFPEWGERLPPALEPLDDRRAVRHRLFRALAELLEQLGTEVLVVEDAHWADTATLEFLTSLTASGHATASLVLTYRPTDIPAGSPLLRLTSRPPARLGTVRLALTPLTVTETAAMVASVFPAEAAAGELVSFLHAHSQGLPLALAETLSLLRDRGELRGAGERLRRRDVDRLAVPPTVRDSVLERVSRLDPATRLLLTAAAVLSEPADEPMLRAVAGLDVSAAQAGLAEVLARGLLREAELGRFEVSHVLAARAVAEATPASERRRLHARAGQALRRLDNPPLARLSHHLREAGDTAGWRRYAEAAADLALAAGDELAAVEALHDLLKAAPPPPPPVRARLARKLGEAAVGGVASLGELAAEVAATLRVVLSDVATPATERGPIRLGLGRLHLQLGEFDEAYAQTQAGCAELTGQPTMAARAMMSLGLPRGNTWPVERHLSWLTRATELLPEVADEADRTSLAVDRASALLLLGQAAGWRAAAEIGDDAPALAQRRQQARGAMNAGHMGVIWGHYRYAEQRLHTAEQLMRDTGYERLLNSARLTRAYLDWHTGAWAGLADRVSEIVAADDTLPEASLEARLVTALLALAAGRRAAAEPELREILGQATYRGLVDTQLLPAAALGRLWLTDGAVTEAVRVTQPGIDLIAGKGVWLWATDLAPVHVAALVRAGQRAAATQLTEEFVAGLVGRDAPAPAAAAQVCRAIVADAAGQPRRAAELAHAAAQSWAALPRRYEELLTLERYGGYLLAAGDPDQALPVLTSAQQGLWALGARWDADRLAYRLRQFGVEVTRTWRGGRRGYGDQLSPRELEVVRLVAQGMTNREVAKVLYLSPRTIDRHLQKAMQKLAVTSRTRLAVAAADTGLLVADGSADAEAEPARAQAGPTKNG